MLFLVFAALLSQLSLNPLQAQDPVNDPQILCSQANLKHQSQVAGYVFRSYALENTGETCLQIIQDGKVIFRRTNDNGGSFTIGQPADKQWKVPAIPNGTDITGRGHPNMIVSQTTGGAHCCLIEYVFELEPKFKLVATLDAQDTWPAYFADHAGDHHYKFFAEDWTFAYWPGSFAGSPFHSVVLQFVDDSRGGAYHLDLDSMRRPVPTPAEWENALSRVRSEEGTDEHGMYSNLPAVFWQEVLDLLYSGHSDLAWKFIDSVGPRAQKVANPILSDFCSQLKSSPYWSDLENTMQDAPAPCTAKKPSLK